MSAANSGVGVAALIAGEVLMAGLGLQASRVKSAAKKLV
jgi:hypothetical protein